MPTLNAIIKYHIITFTFIDTINCGEKQVIGYLDECEIVRYQKQIPSKGLTLRVCASLGQVNIYLTTGATHDVDNSVNLNFTCVDTSCSCKLAYVSGSRHSDVPDRRQLVKREAIKAEITVTVEGTESENVFDVDFTDGDDPNDCVGVKLADSCAKKEQQDTSNQSQDSETNQKPQDSESKLLTIIYTPHHPTTST